MLQPSSEHGPSRYFFASALALAVLFIMFKMSDGPYESYEPEYVSQPSQPADPIVDAQAVSLYEFKDPLLPSVEDVVGDATPRADAGDAPGAPRALQPPEQPSRQSSPDSNALPSSVRQEDSDATRSPKVFDVQQNGRLRVLPRTKHEAEDAPPAAANGGSQARRRPLSYAETRILRSSAQLATRLARTGADAFQRSLMPLEDYAQQLRAVLEIRKARARLERNDAALAAALTDHVAQLRRAAGQLRSFDQPAAAGWRSRSLLAELLTANARLELAHANKDEQAVADWQRRVRELALEHFQSRMQDYKAFGHADLGDLIHAASFLGTPTGRQPTASDKRLDSSLLSSYAGFLQDVVETSETFAARGAGAGRADKVDLARSELARVQGLAALSRGDKSSAKAAFQRSAEAARRMFDARAEFYRNGTASLHDLTEAWRLLNNAASAMPREAGTAQAPDDRLASLVQAADSVADLRGRNRADVAAVHALETLRQLREIEQRVAGNRPDAATRSASPDLRLCR